MTSYSLLEKTLFGASAIVSTWIAIMLLVHLRSWDNEPSAGLQNIHLERTSRLGGVALVFGYVVAVGFGLRLQLIALFPALPLLIAALPVFVVGLWEDVAHRVPPRHRLLAALVSAALASAFAQGIVTRLDLPYVDGWLTYLPFAVLLTLFMVVGACNALNIIDGSHGLAG
jgi:UDP-N-acetylmuramyl pentapeptide phosphotransferase/UDP-N-acetylglucosamine-1-phosphate transferase